MPTSPRILQAILITPELLRRVAREPNYNTL